jgi:tagaturonate reductase
MKSLTKNFLSQYEPSIDITLPKNSFFDLPVKVLQFGEGRFIRAFLDYFIEVANHQGLFNGRAIVIQPRRADKVARINAQDGLFTLCSQGLRNNAKIQEFMINSSIKEAIAAKTEWNETLKLVEIPSIQIIASNTTEAGLVYDPDDQLQNDPPESFPGKLTAMLYHRYEFFDGDKNRGLMMLPLELVENNGVILKQIVLKLAKRWNLEDAFIEWLTGANNFYKCIVDRIVTGYPKAQELSQFQEKLGYEDNFFNIAELYHSWIIEADEKLQTTIPFDEAGLNVQFVSSIKNYFLRKVRILNGAHTSMVPIAYLSGKDSVKESIDDSLINIYIRNLLANEVIPFIDLPKDDLLSYRDTIIERFRNPFLEHKLLTISLYQSSKMRLRVLPSILAYYQAHKSPPPLLLFAFAAFIVFMHVRERTETGWFGLRQSEPYQYQDNPTLLEIFFKAWDMVGTANSEEILHLINAICENLTLWESDLTEFPNFTTIVTNHVNNILKNGMYASLKQLLIETGLV